MPSVKSSDARSAERKQYLAKKSQSHLATLWRAATYGCLLRDCLNLTEAHTNYIECHWGVPAHLLVGLGYASAPSPTAKLVIEHEISKRFGSHLSGIPGLYRDADDTWRINIDAYSLLIPTRTAQGLISGVQFCPNIEEGRLYWLTSKDKFDGSASIAQPHISYIERARRSGIVMLTDHTLLADALANRFNVGALGLNRCKANLVLEILCELSIARAVIAFESPDAAHDYRYILKAIERSGIQVRAAE